MNLVRLKGLGKCILKVERWIWEMEVGHNVVKVGVAGELEVVVLLVVVVRWWW